MATLLSLITLVLAGCGGENTISDSNKQALRHRLATAAPQLQVFSIDPSGDGFNTGYSLFVYACPAQGATVRQTRAQLRKTAHVLWNHADTWWENLNINTQCRGPRATTNPKPPLGITLEMTAAGAKQLWGTPTEVEHEPEISPTTTDTAAVGAGASFEEFTGDHSFALPHRYAVYGPDQHRNSRSVWWTVFVPYGTSKHTRQAKLEHLTAKLWHEHPARLAGIGIHAMAQYPPNWPDDRKHQRQWQKQRPDWQTEYSAKQLQTRFGPRAADLPP